MSHFVFSTPVAARIKDAKYTQFKDALARMGLSKPEFQAVGVTEDGTKVIPYPESLDLSGDAIATPINARLVDFEDPSIVDLLRSHNIHFRNV